MPLSNKLTQLALAGLASGLISTATLAEDKGGVSGKDSSSHGKPAQKGKKAAKAKAAAKDSSAVAMGDSSMTKAMAHDCKGHNECKGMGNCAVSEKDLKELAAKAKIPMEKAGSAHSCMGQNACKGLGGCKAGM